MVPRPSSSKVTAQFRWGPLAPHGPPAPLVEVSLSNGHRVRLVKGLFDTGADHACLRLEWKERLRISDSECFDLDLTGICGKDHPVKGLATVVDATFDGHSLRLPVAFVGELPVDLFGRYRLLEGWKAALDPQAGTTTFERIGAAAPWVEIFEKNWKAELTKKKGTGAPPTAPVSP